jgi:hypothetical protein
MGRRKNPYRKLLHTASISEEALEFIKRYGGTLNKEPFYRRLDRLIANHQLKDTAQLAETVDRQGKMIQFYIDKIKELEKNQQTILSPVL